MTRLLPSPALRGVLLKSGAIALLTVAATLLYLWQHLAMVELGYQVEQARADLTVLKHRRGELMMEVASLSSLDRIERLAREQLNMAEPAPSQLVRVLVSPTAPAGGQPPVLLAANAGR